MPAPVLEAYTEALHLLGNPASTHAHGQFASEQLEAARERIARRLGADPALVTLTGGGTESINLAIKGFYWAAVRRANARNSAEAPVLLIAAGEHHATIEAAEWLRDAQGAELRLLPLDSEGVLQPETLHAAITEIGASRIALVSFLWANNEVGSLQPVAELAAIAREAGVPSHVDAVAALGQVAIDFGAVGVDALSVSAHKIGGPQGAGALVLDKRLDLEPLIAGGGHERGLRSGTENVAAIVGFGEACRLARATQAERAQVLVAQRDRLVAALSALGARVFGEKAERLPNTVYFALPGIDGETLVAQLDRAGFAVASGAACSSANPEPSHVLQAMGVDPLLARGAVRVSLGATTQDAELEEFMTVLQATYRRLQQLAAVAV